MQVVAVSALEAGAGGVRLAGDAVGGQHAAEALSAVEEESTGASGAGGGGVAGGIKDAGAACQVVALVAGGTAPRD